MPDFTIEVTEKVVYGPFTYRDADQLKEDLFSGKLQLGNETGESKPLSIKVKEVAE